MELLEGETLAARIARGALPIPGALRIGVQIADALDRAHRAGIVHRDLKPGNVMLTKSGAKLMDFGLARTAGITAGRLRQRDGRGPAGVADAGDTPDRARDGRGDPGVPCAGAARGARGGRAERPVGARVRALRDDDRAAAFRGGEPGEAARRDPRAGTAPARDPRRRGCRPGSSAWSDSASPRTRTSAGSRRATCGASCGGSRKAARRPRCRRRWPCARPPARAWRGRSPRCSPPSRRLRCSSPRAQGAAPSRSSSAS